jgi:lipoprotein-anchoring transpeptidase ErfK/SrfK
VRYILVTLLFLFVTPTTFAAKRITVDTNTQTLTAYNNETVVFSTPVSTGLFQTPTPVGSFTVYEKHISQDMRGYSVVNGWYYHPAVPFVMYFHGRYAIHGANWHSNFGNRMSNGCVNVSPDSAGWIYNWADNGTSVQIF